MLYYDGIQIYTEQGQMDDMDQEESHFTTFRTDFVLDLKKYKLLL